MRDIDTLVLGGHCMWEGVVGLKGRVRDGRETRIRNKSYNFS